MLTTHHMHEQKKNCPAQSAADMMHFGEVPFALHFSVPATVIVIAVIIFQRKEKPASHRNSTNKKRRDVRAWCNRDGIN